LKSWLRIRLQWVGPELINGINRGDPPLLSDKQVRHANANVGLNLVVWEGSPDKPLGDLIKRPYALGLTRELAAARMGTWMASLFVCQQPRFGFRPNERRLLLAAL